MKAPYRTWAEISRERIVANYHAIRAATGGGVQVVPVVKANAYGHGSVEVSRVLEAEGARWLAVSSVGEGVALRAAGIDARILVMADFLPQERQALMENSLTPVVHRLDEIAQLDRLAARQDKPVPFHLKIDSGMSRLGTLEDADRILSALNHMSHLHLEGLMTHFASAADFTSPQTEQQIRLFDSITTRLRRAGVEPVYFHLSASAPIAYGRAGAWRNMVRTGLALYGYVSPPVGEAPPSVLSLQPALAWKAALLEIKRIPKGAGVGYGAVFRAQKPMTIGVVAVGYGDGFPYHLSNKGHVIAAGRLVKILGAVSMDLTTIDLTGVPRIEVGDTVTLLGSEGNLSIDADDIAGLTGTISYDVLCGIGPRVHRIYV